MPIYRKKRGIFVNILLAYRYGWVEHTAFSTPSDRRNTNDPHIYIYTTQEYAQLWFAERRAAFHCRLHSFSTARAKKGWASPCRTTGPLQYVCLWSKFQNRSFWGAGHVAVVISLLFLQLSLSLSQFQPIFMSFVAISSVKCRCFKAMWFVEFYPKQGLNNWRKLLFAPCKRIGNPGPWNPEYSSRNPESKFHWKRSGIQHLEFGIQNPRLSWIPLNGGDIVMCSKWYLQVYV